jgi:hypothetical protein
MQLRAAVRCSYVGGPRCGRAHDRRRIGAAIRLQQHTVPTSAGLVLKASTAARCRRLSTEQAERVAADSDAYLSGIG